MRRQLGDWWLVLVVACCALTALGGCKRVTQSAQRLADHLAGKDKAVAVGEVPAPGSLVASRYRFRAAVYTTSAPTKDVSLLLKRLAGEHFTVVADAEEANKTSGAVVYLTTPPIADFAPPKLDSMKTFAPTLDEAQQKQLFACQSASVFTFQGPGSKAGAQYHAALQLIDAMAGELDGFPEDDDVRHTFTRESWKKLFEHWQGDEPILEDHVTLDYYRDGELYRIVSLGMSKFALPDITINQLSAAESGHLASLSNLVIQTMYEQGKLGKDGSLLASIEALRQAELRGRMLEDLQDNAKKQVLLRLAVAKKEEGDADNRLLELVFPGSVVSLQERQAAAVSELFGSKDEIVNITHDDELLAASARARQKATLIGKRYAKGPPFGEQLSVKAPFETTKGGDEWMWVEVVTWNGDKIRGILKNDPFDVPSLKDGARVEVQASKIFDYILTKADGKEEGNETGRMIEEREKAGAPVRKK